MVLPISGIGGLALLEGETAVLVHHLVEPKAERPGTDADSVPRRSASWVRSFAEPCASVLNHPT